MLSPRLSRKPGKQIHSPTTKLLRSRIQGEQCSPVVYISPKKGNTMSKLASYIEDNQTAKFLDTFADNQNLRRENISLKQKNKKLEETVLVMKRKLKQSDCNIVQLTNNLYSTGEELFARRNIKSKVRMISHSKHKSNFQDSFAQPSQLKHLAQKNNSIFNNNKQIGQTKTVFSNISNKLPESQQLKEANKTIAQLRVSLDTANVNLKILEHKLLVKEQFIQKLKIRQCQKMTSKAIEFDGGYSSKQYDLGSSVNSWFDLGYSKEIQSNAPQFERTQLGQSVNSYYNYIEQLK